MNRTDDLNNRMAGLMLGRSGRGNPGKDLAPPPKVRLAAVRVRVLAPFHVDGELQTRGSTVTLDTCTAGDLAARGKVELL